MAGCWRGVAGRGGAGRRGHPALVTDHAVRSAKTYPKGSSPAYLPAAAAAAAAAATSRRRTFATRCA